MKSYDELTNDLLERRDRYVAEQKRKRANAICVAAPLGCLCLVAVLGFTALQSGLLGTAIPNPTEGPVIGDDLVETTGVPATDPAGNNKIVINAIEEVLSGEEMGIALLLNDFVEMTREEMIAYMGVDYVPTVPEDIKARENQMIGLFRRENGTGEVYWDRDVMDYSNEDSSRWVTLTVDKGGYVFFDFVIKGTEEKSTVNDLEVLIGQMEDGVYYAEFVYKGVGFYLAADGLTEGEFVDIIASVIK